MRRKLKIVPYELSAEDVELLQQYRELNAVSSWSCALGCVLTFTIVAIVCLLGNRWEPFCQYVNQVSIELVAGSLIVPSALIAWPLVLRLQRDYLANRRRRLDELRSNEQFQDVVWKVIAHAQQLRGGDLRYDDDLLIMARDERLNQLLA